MMKEIIPADFEHYTLGNELTAKEYVDIFVKKFYKDNNGIEFLNINLCGIHFFRKLFRDICKRWSIRKRHKISGYENFIEYLSYADEFIEQSDYRIINEALEKFCNDDVKKFYYIMCAIDDLLFGKEFYFCGCCGGAEGTYCMMQFISYYYFKER